MISVYPNVHVYRMPGGLYDAFCRACRTLALVSLESDVRRFKAKHERCVDKERSR